MFQSATWRLTATYIGILAIISFIFSVNLYRVSYGELTSGLNRQAVSYRQLPGIQGLFNDDDLSQIRQNQLERGRHEIIAELIYLNIILLTLGGVGSYFLARRTLQPIKEAHDAQSRFTADASHELRTPLSAMRTEIEVALRDPRFSRPSARTLLESNLEELTKLTILVENLLRLARQENGHSHFEPISMPGVIEAAVAQKSAEAQKKKITIETNVADVDALGNPDQLIQLVVILLDNAIKYSPANELITISVTLGEAGVVLKVHDNGHGIKATDVPHIFERFYRADHSRTKDAPGGYGLGLAIAKQIVDYHRGQITVESRPGRGTTLTVLLPAA